MEFEMTPGNATAAAVPKRREMRMPVKLDVRILGIDSNGKAFHQPATTLNISKSGARVTGLTAPLNKGDIVGLQSSGAKSRFRVAWVRSNRDGTFQVGMQCKEKGGCPWGGMTPQAGEGDRRGDERVPCEGSVTLRSASIATPIWGSLRDLNSHGCYVHSFNVAPVGDILSGQFIINGVPINGVAEVRSSFPAEGMGLQWCDLGYDGQEKLNGILRSLRMGTISVESAKEMALSQVNQLLQQLTTLREGLVSGNAPVNADTIGRLSDAQKGLTAALRSMQG